ncbi:MAG: CoA pyrophosphatase [Crocinitomicaceae bacterium]|nr:CoA pyrophosphatase [Crocinitomicaceae bacterium]MBK8924850.1 CoA pyrophosphatase [Crocinitomicaceae bacterium]
MRAKTSDALKKAENYKLSAVLALVYEQGIDERIIIMERPEYDGNHSGQICFPGGRKEETDYTPLEAALRETYEETGITPDKIEILGALTPVYIPVSNYLVYPFIGYLNEPPVFHPDPHEVKAIHSFSLTELFKPENRIHTNVKSGKGILIKDVPAFLIDQKIIWGATALMLNEIRVMLERLNR